jgi:inosose dehydratase
MPPLSTNQYPWDTFYRREGKNFADNLPASFAEVIASGFTALEPNLESVEMVDAFVKAAKPLGVTMPTIYVNSVLHDHTANTSIEEVLRIATRARDLAQTTIVVTNPRPIRWGGPENKSDAEIITQGKALEKLGAALHREGITLAYHNHDSEFRLGAREYHHMHNATDPAHVKFCLDPHWVYRGSGNSEVAVFDTVALYGSRVVELHLRQSTQGIWTETFTPTGDINYPRLLTELSAQGVHPFFTLEQAVEDGSPHTLNSVEAHRVSLSRLKNLTSQPM